MAELTEKLRIRTSKALRAALDAEAERMGVRVSEHIRRTLAASADPEDVLPVVALADFKILEQLRLDLARLGGNLNQIAHHLNAGDPSGTGDLGAMLEALRPHFDTCVITVKGLRDELARRAK